MSTQIPLSSEEFWRAIRARHPTLREALVADAKITARYRGERHEFRSQLDVALQILRLMWVSDALLPTVLYRVKARLQALGVPVLPRIAHRLAMITGQVSIGDPVVVEPGVYIVHGQTVIDGLTVIGAGAVISPWTTIGLRSGIVQGPTLGADVSVGTGAKVLGAVHVGDGAQIGANAVVIDDVPAKAVVVESPRIRCNVPGMWPRRRKHETNGAVGLAEPPTAEELNTSPEQLRAEIETLTAQGARDPKAQRRLLRLRHALGIEQLDTDADPAFAEPDVDRLPSGHPLPEIPGGVLTPGIRGQGSSATVACWSAD